MLVLMCATTMTSMAACGAKEPVTPEVTKAVTETKTAEEQETVSETVGMPNPWTDAGYTYSVSTLGLSESEMENIIQQIE